MNNITTISIDLAKSVFQVCTLNKARKVIFNKQIKRHNLINQIRQYPNATISMEACSSAHHWARTFAQMGLKVKLIPAQHVKAFVRGNKNDSNDALAQLRILFGLTCTPCRSKVLSNRIFKHCYAYAAGTRRHE